MVESVSLNNPTVDGQITKSGTNYVRSTAENAVRIGPDGTNRIRAYFEWDVTSIPDGSTIINTLFKYEGGSTIAGHAHAMASQPSAQSNDNGGNQVIYDDIGDGTVYADPVSFPNGATNNSVDLGATANSDLQTALINNWFAIGAMKDNEDDVGIGYFMTEEEVGVTPPPTLYVEYTLPAVSLDIFLRNSQLVFNIRLSGVPAAGWMKIAYLTEPPTAGAFNKIAYEVEPPVSNAWNKLKYG